MTDRPKTQVRKSKGSSQRVTQLQAHKGEQATCACGCGASFIRDRATQKYIEDHRFRAYVTHACPDCGSMHRVPAKQMSNA